MRPFLFVALGLGVAASAHAQPAPSDDDERPGARSGARAPDNDSDSDTPEAGDEATPTRKTVDVHGGDAPVRLKGRGDKPGTASQVTAHPEGAYAGVTIGGEGLPPHPPKLPLKGPQRMLWPGFQVRDGVPTVFLQTTGTPSYVVADGPGALTVTLRSTKIQLRNNQRPLKVGEFGTSVTEIAAKAHGRDVVVTIKHKGDAAHREHVEPSAGGYQLLVVELPGK